MSGFMGAPSGGSNPIAGLPPSALQALMQQIQAQRAGGTPPGVPGPMTGGPAPPAGGPPMIPGGGTGPMPMPPQGAQGAQGAPPAGGPLAIAGGGAVPMSPQGVQGAVPMSARGVPAMGPHRFSGIPVPPGATRAPGGPNAQGGANPYQIHPPSMTTQQMASAGRYGDSVIAHLTPGEIQVPPEIQNPQLMAALRNAFKTAGVDVSQFTAGSPATTKNPVTGAEENSLWSVLLPIAGAAAGSFIGAPEIGMALGGAAGGLAGGLIDHTSTTGMLAQAAMGGLGGYIAGSGGLSSLLGSGAGVADATLPTAAASAAPAASAATDVATNAATTAGASGATGVANATLPAVAGSGIAPGTAGGAGGGWGMVNAGGSVVTPPIPPSAIPASTGVANVNAPGTSGGFNGGADLLNADGSVVTPPAAQPTTMQSLISALKKGWLAGAGSTLGGMLAPPSSNTAAMDQFNGSLPPLNRNYGQLLGSNQATTPQFNGYNPYTSVTQPGGYSFFPTA